MNFKALLLLTLGHMVTDTPQGGLPVMLPFIKDALHLSYTQAGAVIMVMNLTSSVIQPLFGHFADRWSAMWLLPLGVALAGLGLGVVGLTPNYHLLLAAVVISGLGVASYHPEAYRCVLASAGRRKATGISWFMVGGNTGLALGPLLATTFYAWAGLKGMAWFMLPGLVMAGLLLLSWPRLTAYRRGAGAAGAAALPPQPIGRRWRPLALLTGAVVVRSWVHAGVTAFVPFYYVQAAHGDPLMVGSLLSTFLLAGAIGTLVGAPIADRYGAKKFLLASLSLTTPLMFAFLLADGWGLFVVLALMGAILLSSMTVVIVMAQQILPDRAATASGLMVGFAIGAGGIGATFLGWVADGWGVRTVFELLVVLPVLGVLAAVFLPGPPAEEPAAPAEAGR